MNLYILFQRHILKNVKNRFSIDLFFHCVVNNGIILKAYVSNFIASDFYYHLLSENLTVKLEFTDSQRKKNDIISLFVNLISFHSVEIAL